MTFILTPKQAEAQDTLAGPATHVLLEGGGRSGKTSLIVHNIGCRAIKAPGSEHAILRFRFNHCKASIVLDTFPKVMKAAFPEVHYRIDKQDWYAEIAAGMQSSRIWFGGIDDKERTEKILGKEFASIFLNEISQIPFESREIAVTRLAQLVMQHVKNEKDGKVHTKALKPRVYYDQNPASKAHWAYKMFHQGIDPDSKRPLGNPQDFAHFKINPIDNMANITPEYLKILQSLSAAKRKRFLEGEYAETDSSLLFNDVDIEKWRILDDELPAMVRIAVGVDPSGADDAETSENDEIGIVAGGLGTDGNAYLLEDVTVKAGPGTWGKVVGTAFERHEADIVVGEGNYGGAMVEHVIQTARPRTPYRMVTATRGKAVRAEPFSALYEQGRVRHAGNFQKLEDELCQFSTRGYLGEGSPNRADAWIWVLAELFAGIVAPKRVPPKQSGAEQRPGTTFMSN